MHRPVPDGAWSEYGRRDFSVSDGAGCSIPYGVMHTVGNNVCYNKVDGNAPGNGTHLFLALNITGISNECYGNASAGIRLIVSYDEFTE